ncbi:hypothetical protein ROHU_031211 [Labeo rohita]|uniref:Uncharacterized protein n=1 Tax=Labeo rohita TaxID=84645 RepID=A0A498LP48_LABRO|nr:hypothetical protein ROHU_031211 [Labeo rohita]
MSRCPPSGAAAEVEKSLVAHIYGEWHTSAERDGSCSWTARPELETPSKVRREVSSKAWDDSKYQRSTFVRGTQKCLAEYLSIYRSLQITFLRAYR